MKPHRHPLAIALTTGLGLVMLSSIATAGNYWDWDRKSYTGAQCQPAFGSQSSDFTIFQGTLRNDAAGNRWVSCAITFDTEDALNSADSDTATSPGGFALRVHFDYSAVTGSPQTGCILAGRTPYGTSMTQTKGVTASQTASDQAINFDAAPLDGLSIGSDATIQISCFLPPTVALKAVKVYEYGETDGYRYIP